MRQAFVILLLLAAIAPALAQKKGGKAVKGIGYDQQRKLTELFFEGSKQKMLGNSAEAMALFHECIKLDGTHAASFYELANILYKEGNISDALPFARRARQLMPSNDWYNLFEADILLNLNDPNAAIAIYQGLVKRHPGKVEFLLELASAYLFTGRYDEAIKVYNRIEEVTGVSEDISLQKEKIFLEMNRLKEAVAELERLIEAFPGEQRYLGMLSEVYIANDLDEKAFQVYERMLENDPSDPILHLSMAEFYKRKGNYEKSYASLLKAFASPDLSIDQKVPVLMSYFMLTERDTRLLPQAYELLALTTSAHPDEPKAFAMRADFLYRDRRVEEARESFYTTVRLDSSRFPVWAQLIQTSYDLRDWEAMQRDSKTALELFPNQGALYLLNGIANNQMKRFKEAVSVLQEGEMYARVESNLYVELLSVMADALHSQGRHQESDEAFDRALAREPSNALVLNNYAYFLSLRGEKLERAEEMSRRSNVLRPNQASFQDTYAWVMYRMGKFEDALEWIDKAIANGGGSSGTIVEHRGDILYKLGRVGEAKAEWAKAKQFSDHSDELAKKLQTGRLDD